MLLLGAKYDGLFVVFDHFHQQLHPILLTRRNFNDAIEIIYRDSLNTANVELNKKTPWKLDKSDPERKKILEEVIEYILVSVKFLKPIMPETCEKVEKIFEGEIKPLEKPLFPRI